VGKIAGAADKADLSLDYDLAHAEPAAWALRPSTE
jgi:hypothetical protein